VNAITTKNIDCPALGFGIPAGTKFNIVSVLSVYSICTGLGITQIWNDEFRMLDSNLTQA